MKDALVVIDVINDFRHEDGEALLVRFRARHAGLLDALERAAMPAYPSSTRNDNWGRWDSDAPGLVRQAIEHGRAGELVAAVQPRAGDRFVLKPRYSAFDATPLELLLRDLAIDRILLAGTATEMCVAQTAIAGRELGFKVTVLAAACACVDETDEQVALEYLKRVVGACIEERWPESASPRGEEAASAARETA